MEERQTLSLSAHAKINLFLEISGKRNDGFHDLVSVFQEIDLADTLTAMANVSGQLTLDCDQPWLSTGPDNLILLAAAGLRNRLKPKTTTGIHFSLQKVIPAGAGLGGGSSDAAAALKLCAKIWGLKEHDPLLEEVAAETGSDVAFFLTGGTCLCEGRGERITPLAIKKRPAVALILVLPPWKISTEQAYKALGPVPWEPRSVELFLHVLSEENPLSYFEQVIAESFNRFEEIVFELKPDQRSMHELFESFGVTLRMSGTGSAAWGINENEDELPGELQRILAERKIEILSCSWV